MEPLVRHRRHHDGPGTPIVPEVGPFLDLNIVFNVVALMAVPDAPATLLAGLGSWGGGKDRPG